MYSLNDIVVFNFPAGDTVATGVPNDDIYRLSYRRRQGAGKTGGFGFHDSGAATGGL